MVFNYICACVCIVIAGYEFILLVSLKRRLKSKTNGTVVSLRTSERGQSIPVFRYIINGEEYENEIVPLLLNKKKYKTGTKKTLRYSDDDERIIIDPGFYGYVILLAIVALGITVIVLTALHII